MAYDAITAGQVDAESPIDTTLMAKIKDNFDSHETRILNGESGGFPVGAVPAVGDYIVVANDEDQGVDPGTYTKVKETIWKGQAGAFRIKFSMRSPGGDLLYGRIYRNGSAIGTERSTSSTSNVEFSEDISGWNNGDLIQVYIYRAAGTGTCYASKLRLCVAAPAIGGQKHGF